MSNSVIDAIQDLRKDDIIIAFMGVTGAGKSYFIDLLTNEKGKRSAHSLNSTTVDIQATRVKHPVTGLYNIVLVDTPGFGDTFRSDMQILSMIGDWLERTYKRDVTLSGLVYLHDITDSRVTGTAYRSLCMFHKLFGDSATVRIVLVSTKWGDIKRDVAEGREVQLKEQFWKPLIENGSHVERLDQGDCGEAWRIIDDLIRRHKEREVYLLQGELDALWRKLKETEEGRVLYATLQTQLAYQEATLRRLAHVEKYGDPTLKKDLEKEYKKNQDQLQKTFNEVKKLKVPLGKRIWMFLFGKIIHAKSIKATDNH